MELQYKIDDLSQVDESLQPLYKQNEDGGSYSLQVQGVVEKSKLKEFRDNNITYLKEKESFRDQLKAYDGITPEQAKEFQLKALQLENEEIVKTSDIRNVINEKTNKVTQDYEQRLQHLQQNVNDLSKTLENERQEKIKML